MRAWAWVVAVILCLPAFAELSADERKQNLDSFDYVWKTIQEHGNFEPTQPKDPKLPPQPPGLDKVAFAAHAKLIADAMLHDPGFDRAYKVHWDNSDDTSFDGPLLASRHTGQVRMISMWMPA